MSSLRNILQRCASRNSILGSTPLQIQWTFNPVCSAYPTSISRQAYSSDANDAPKNDPVRKYILEMMNAKKSPTNVAKDQKASKSTIVEDKKASKAPTFNKTDSMNSRPNTKSWPSFTKDQRAAKAPTFNKIDSMKSPPKIAKDKKGPSAPIFNKNLNLRKYYINIRGLSKDTTPESLRKFYSQFGEIAVCNIIFPGKSNQFGSVAFLEKKAMDRALNSLPHCIDGKRTNNVGPSTLGRKELTLQVLDLSPKSTTKSLNAFYSKFGRLDDCWIKQRANAKVGEVTFVNQKDMHRALDAQPHVIDGSEVLLLYATFDLDLKSLHIPEGITEEALREFYSKYGQLRACQFFKGKAGPAYAYVSYSAIDEVNRAMDDRPHIIGGKPLHVNFLGRGHIVPVSLFVGSLPENVTEETLREEFSKYGKPVYWALNNDEQFNQSGPYGLVTYGCPEEALKVLKSGPHTIKGAVVDVRMANEAKKSWPGREKSIVTDKNTLTFEIRDVPEGVTVEELIHFYSKYGRVRECRLQKGKMETPRAYVSFSTIDEVNRAMDDRPHIIGGKPLKIKFIGGEPLRMNAKKSPTDVAEDQKASKSKIVEDKNAAKVPIFEASKAPTFNKTDSMNSRPNIKSWPNVAKDQKTSKALTFNKTDFRPRTHQLLNTNRELKFRPTVTKDQRAAKAPTFNKIGSMNSRPNIKHWPSVTQDQKVYKASTFSNTDSMNSRPNIKFRPTVAEYQRAAKAPTFNKNLNLRKYYIRVSGISKETTPESIRKFYSQFGEIAVCKIVFPGKSNQFGEIAFSSKEAMDRALNALPHCIDGKEIKNVRPAFPGKEQLTLKVVNLSPKTTTESFTKFYSRFGRMNYCRINQGTTAEVGQDGDVTFSSQIELHRALDAQPHVIDGSEVLLLYATYDLDLKIEDMPEGVTEDDLNAFYSKYGQLRVCRLSKGKTGIRHAYVSFSAVSEFNRAIDDRPHIIGGKPLQIKFLGRDHAAPVSLFVGSLPENVTEETLREEFSKYGKPVYWVLKNDGQFNQSGPYGIVAYGSQEEAIKVLNSRPHTIDGSVVDVRKPKESRESFSKALNVLNSGPHTIKGSVVDVRIANEANKSLFGKEKSIDTDENTLRKIIEIRDVPEGVTKEELIAFYSKYGRVEECRLVGLVTYGCPEEALKALKNGPHTIKGAVVDVRMANEAKKSWPGKEKSIGTDKNTLTFEIRDVPEGVTKEDLIAFYSKYGRVRECRLRNGKTGIPHAFVSYSAVDEVNRAMDDCPHIIGGKPLNIKINAKGHSESHYTPVSLFVGSLPENVTEETLGKEFSKYGKPVYWELKNDRHFNQSGPYGFVTYGSEEEALNVLNSGPHTIEGSVVDVRIAKEANESLPGNENCRKKIVC